MSSIFSNIGAGVSDIFAGFGAEDKAQAAELEAESYEEAATYAKQEKYFTTESTAIQQSQANRALYTSLGKTQAAVAGAGFAQSGSAVDILRSSAQQGAMTSAVIGRQGLITEAGYQEQATADELAAQAAQKTASADSLSGIGDFIGAGINAVAAIATGGLTNIGGVNVASALATGSNFGFAG